MVGENIKDEIIRWTQVATAIVCFISVNSKDRPYPKLEREIAVDLNLDKQVQVIYFNLDETIIDVTHSLPYRKYELQGEEDDADALNRWASPMVCSS